MRRATGVVGAVGFLLLIAGEAFAQYPPGYGGYGWGGWGSTPQGDMARGLGSFAMGAGARNVENAQANAINSDTVMRWNQANWETQHAINVSYGLRRLRRRERIDAAQAGIYDRMRNHPEQHDIENGDALNVALDELLNPKVYGSVIRTVRTPLSNSTIRAIPFEHASEAATICLDELSAKDGWPPALREEVFAPYRKALQDATQAALLEDEKGDLLPATIQKVADAVEKLRVKFEATVPQNSPDYLPAANHIKALAGTARLLHSPQVEQILAGLEKYPGTTVGDLLAFMHIYNLRFAPAKTPQQREIYEQLFLVLDKLRDDATEGPAGGVEKATQNALAQAGTALTGAENSISSAARRFFQAMGWQHLGGTAH
jgi:hypothetical protein